MGSNRINHNPAGRAQAAAGGVLRLKSFWRLIGYLSAVIIIVVSIIPNPDEITPFSASDKLLHALAYGLSMLWFGFCFRGKKLLYIAAGLVLLGIVLEVIQGQTGYRSMSFYDAVANTIGVLIGLIISYSRFSRSLYFIERMFFK